MALCKFTTWPYTVPVSNHGDALGVGQLGPESLPKIGNSFAARSQVAPCNSETESPGTDEVEARFAYTNPTFCSSFGSADTAPEMTLIRDKVSRHCMSRVHVHMRVLTYCQYDQSGDEPGALSQTLWNICCSSEEPKLPSETYKRLHALATTLVSMIM